MTGGVIRNAVLGVTKKWSKQRKAEQREASRASRRSQAWIRSDRVTIKDSAYRAMPEAYRKASGGGSYAAHARQIMYAARGKIQEATGDPLDDKYFTQVLLPNYMSEHPQDTADWNVVFDARGNLAEPHTETSVPLGTINVRKYLSESGSAPHENTKPQLDTTFPTNGPRHRYSAILFCEKEGFMPLFEQVELAERYDVALMSTKGLSTTASRLLVDELCSDHQIPLLVLHDFDKSGFSIIGTLTRDTRRYSFSNEIRVVDLGLRLGDIEEMGLESEDVSYGKSDPRDNLRDNGATDEEVELLCDSEGNSWSGYSGKRVELNAMTSDQLVEWIEGKLEANGIEKLVPDGDTLIRAYRRAITINHINQGIDALSDEASKIGAETKIPPDLDKRIRDHLDENPADSWDDAISALVEMGAA